MTVQRWTGLVSAHESGGFVAVGDYLELEREVAELKSKLAKYEKREPVAWLSWRAKDGYEYWETKREAELYCAGDTDPEPLYLGVKNE